MTTTKIRKTAKKPPPDTIWELPDGLWGIIESLLEERYPAKGTGRPRVGLRPVIDGIIFRMRTGCQWNKMPERFGSDRTVHRWFQRFCRDGFFEQLWGLLATTCDDLGGVDWRWQSADGRLGKARFGGEKGGPQPDRSGQAGDQGELDRGGVGAPAGGGHRRGERAGLQAAAGDDRGDRGGAARADA